MAGKFRPDQNCYECQKPLAMEGYVTVFQYFFHPTCLKCKLCKKALTPPTTDLFCAQTFCMGHRGKEISPTTACFQCKKRLPNVFGPDVIVGNGNGYHKACMVCIDCQKGPPQIPVEDMKKVNGNFACAACLEARRIYKCECCPVKAIKTDLIAGPSQKTYYCQKCYLCCECRSRLMPDEKVYEIPGKLYCKNCERRYETAKALFDKFKCGS